MGGGSWTASAYATKASCTTGVTYDASTGIRHTSLSAQEYYKSRGLKESLNPHKVLRECCNTEEHPNTVPVILGLDVTGSMGSTAMEVAKKLNVIMTQLYKEVKDVEFCIMGIGDLHYDSAPIQMSQFESDIRIDDHLDDVYFEGGGGGNDFESYTAAWYMGARHTKLDCWDQGRKGIIITLGDEPLNPYLEAKTLASVTGDSLQGDIETADLYKEVLDKFDVYHISVDDKENCYEYNASKIKETWDKTLGNHHIVSKLDSLASTVSNLIKDAVSGVEPASTDASGNIVW